MVEQCRTCFRESEKMYCGFKKSHLVKLLVGFGSVFFIIITILMAIHFKRKDFEGWSYAEQCLFFASLCCFSLCFIVVVYFEIRSFFEVLWSFMCGIWAYTLDFFRFIRNMKLPSWQDTRAVLTRRILPRSRARQEISSGSESGDEERPPLPLKSRRVAQAAAAEPFQKAYAKPGEGEDSRSRLLGRPHSSTHSAKSPKLSGRTGKKLSKRESFKNLLSSVINLKPIHEEDSNQQEASNIQVPLSVLTGSLASSVATEEETSFTLDPQPTETSEPHMTAKSGESHEHSPPQEASELQTPTRMTGAIPKRRGPGQTLTSKTRASDKEQSSGAKDSDRKLSPEQPSTSRYVPFLDIQNQALASGSGEVQRTQASASGFSGSHWQLQASDIRMRQWNQDQASVSYIGLPELEKQSREFGSTRGTERKQNSPEQQPAPSYVKASELKSPAKERTSASEFSGSRGQEHASDIQRQGSPNQASASFMRLPKLEKETTKFDTRTEGKQNSPEQSTSSYVPVSALENQAQKQTSAEWFSGTRDTARASDTQRRQDLASASYVGLPELEKHSKKFGTRTERKQRSPEQPASSYVPVSVLENRNQEQTLAAVFSGSHLQARATDIQRSQGSIDQASASYISLPELEKQSREFGTRTERKQSSPEQPASSYVPVSVLENRAPEQTLSTMFSGSDLQASSTDVQGSQGSPYQASASYVCLPELEKQSREFGTITEKKQSSPEQPALSYVPVSILENKDQEQTSAAMFSGSQGQALASDVQRWKDQGSTSCVGLPEIKKHSMEFDTRGIERKQSSLEQPAPIYVPFSPPHNQDQGPDVHRIGKMRRNRRQASAVGVPCFPRRSQITDVQRSQDSVELTPVPHHVERPGLKQQSQEESQSLGKPWAPSYVQYSTSEKKPDTSGTAETQKVQGSRECASEAEFSTSQEKTPAFDIQKKLRNLEQASVAGFPGAISHTGHSREGQERTSSAEYMGPQRPAREPEREIIEKRREALSTVSETSVHTSDIRGIQRREKTTGGIPVGISGLSAQTRAKQARGIRRQQQFEATSGGYMAHSAFSRSGRTLAKETGVTVPRSRMEDVEEQNRQRAMGYSSGENVVGAEKRETQKTEKILSLNLATGGLVLSNPEKEEGECEAYEPPPFMYDQPMDVLDLSHIEVPPLPKEETDKDQGQN